MFVWPGRKIVPFISSVRTRLNLWLIELWIIFFFYFGLVRISPNHTHSGGPLDNTKPDTQTAGRNNESFNSLVFVAFVVFQSVWQVWSGFIQLYQIKLKDFSRKGIKFKGFSILYEPCLIVQCAARILPSKLLRTVIKLVYSLLRQDVSWSKPRFAATSSTTYSSSAYVLLHINRWAYMGSVNRLVSFNFEYRGHIIYNNKLVYFKY